MSHDSNRGVRRINFDEFIDVVERGEAALVYFGDPEAANFDNVLKDLETIKKDYDVSVNIVDTTELSEEDQDELVYLFTDNVAFVFVSGGTIVHVNEGPTELDTLRRLVDRHFRNILLPEDIAYNTLETFDEFMKVVNSRTPAMFVIGRDSCPACTAFKPIFNDVAGDHDANIWYLNSDVMDRDEWDKIMTESKLTIPGSCRSDGDSIELFEIESVPTTIFTERGRIVDCMTGVVQRDALELKLRDVKIIK